MTEPTRETKRPGERLVHSGLRGGLIKAWVDGVSLDDNALTQLENVASLPFIYKWVAAMPDAHWGRGATVGSVIATQGAIIPAAVGVDLGCGMIAQRLSITASQLPSDLKPIRSEIERAVPHGRTDNGGRGDRGAWHDIPAEVSNVFDFLRDSYTQVIDRAPKIGKGNDVNHLGTLGTGNHFIELCLDESQNVWVMLHSGSRGVGNRIGSYYIEKAKEDMRRWFINLPDQDLAYLLEGSVLFSDYVKAVSWAQSFAKLNRDLMLDATIRAVRKLIPEVHAEGYEAVNCHHNYIAHENHYGQNVWVTRKGAVRARQGDLGIIPGSMGAKSYIVRGKGDPESFHSCSHGAGRVMSRGEAKRKITLADHELATAGVECRKDADVLDESPAAYKPIDQVMAAQQDLVEIVHTLRGVLCVKG